MTTYRGQRGKLFIDAVLYSEPCTYVDGTEPVDWDAPGVDWIDGGIGGEFTPIGVISDEQLAAGRVTPGFIGAVGDIALGDARFSFKITRGASSTSGSETERHRFGGRYFGGININGIHSGVYCELVSTSATKVTLLIQERTNFIQRGVFEATDIDWAQLETGWLGFDIAGNEVELWSSTSTDCQFADRTIHGSFTLTVLTSPASGEGSLLIGASEAFNETGTSFLDDFKVIELPSSLIELKTWRLDAGMAVIDDTVKGDLHKTYRGALAVWEGEAGAYLDAGDTRQAILISQSGSLGIIVLQTDDDKKFCGEALVDNFNTVSHEGSSVAGIGFSFRGTGQVLPKWT